jgi:rhodanese-related sulfurtransferase
MSSVNSIASEKLARLIGTPKCPALVDVRGDDGFSADPRLVPGSVRRSADAVGEWAAEFRGRSVVVICHKGLKFSDGVAAFLREAGASADVLEEGFAGWARSGLSLVATDKLPPRNAHGRTLWITRERPKIDRIACPWLIRRFVDPAALFLFVAPSEVLGVAEQFGGAPFDIEGVSGVIVAKPAHSM